MLDKRWEVRNMGGVADGAVDRTELFIFDDR